VLYNNSQFDESFLKKNDQDQIKFHVSRDNIWTDTSHN